ncbi:hypothetical protein [Pedobacter punctiformis]|uniref:Uncharacterized protein n=1 Tax=Pedobacter punctiformis TaxID=3004097 RepID=A0ABT4LAJ3_9SPHI|nr:hypothetical protein [Pedobacter sp. HCMS5-2]MCZ4244947.1 hypothetical protein [Pedobacter sp. HCMS5-2]
MKTKIEIIEKLKWLEDLRDRGEYEGSDVDEIAAKIIALQWVLGIQSSIDN